MLFGSKDCIGLDIGSSAIKAVQLKEKKGRHELAVFDMLPLPPELIVEGSIIDSLRLVDALKELKGKARIKTKNAVLGIAGHASVIIRRISLPEMSEEELAESIKFEAEQYVPFDVEDVNIDFEILGSKEEEEGEMEVMLVAVKKDIINEYVSVVKEAGFNPVVMDVNAFALGNMYETNYAFEPEKNVALVNIGASSINLNIMREGMPLFTRDSAMGSNRQTENIQKHFDIPYEDAERLKRGESIESVTAEDLTSVVGEVSQDMVDEIGRSLEFFRSTSYEDVHEIVLCGGGALIREFPMLLADNSGIEVTVAEPFRNITVPKKFDHSYLEEVGPMFSVAVGLALRKGGDR